MSRRLFHALTAVLVVAAVVVWRQILTARDEVASEIGPYGPPVAGAYTFPATHIVCSPDYVAAVVSVRGGNKVVCAPLDRGK